MGRENLKRNIQCKYSDSCFNCPLSDCKVTANKAAQINQLEKEFEACPQEISERFFSTISDMEH